MGKSFSDLPYTGKKKPDQLYIEICDIIGELTTFTKIIDYGCDDGNFLRDGLIPYYGDEKAKVIEYVGVDIDKDKLKIAKESAELSNLAHKIRGEPQFMLDTDYFKTDGEAADFIVCSRTLHDIKLAGLCNFFYHNLRILKKGGRFIFYDKGLVEENEETIAVAWDFDDFNKLFQKTSIDVKVWPKYRNGKREIVAILQRTNEEIPHYGHFDRSCPQVYERKKIKLHKLIRDFEKNEGENPLDVNEKIFRNICKAQHCSLTVQLEDFRKAELEDNVDADKNPGSSFGKISADSEKYSILSDKLAYDTILALSSSDRTQWEWMPFDISTIWALNRSPYIAVLFSDRKKNLASLVVHVEQKFTTINHSLPVRLWLSLDIRNITMLPQTQDDIGRIAKKMGPDIPRHLSSGNILGFYFEIPMDYVDQDWIIAISTWSKTLVKDIFRDSPPAVLFNLFASNESKVDVDLVKQRMKQLGKRLKQDNLCGDLMFTSGLERFGYENNCAQADSIATRPTFLLGDISTQRVYVPVFSWVIEALERMARRYPDNIDLNREYKHYMDLIKLCRGRSEFDEYVRECYPPSGYKNPFFQQSTTQVVVEGITSLLASEREYKRIHRQFLELIEKYIPEHIESLVASYAEKGGSKARLESLIFSSRNDTLIDRWIEASGFAPSNFPDSRELTADPDPKYRSFVNKLALALLRQYNRCDPTDEQKRYGIEFILRNYMNRVDYNLETLCKFCFSHASKLPFAILTLDDVYANYFDQINRGQLTNNLIKWAVQAGIEGSILVESKRAQWFNNPEFWWLLTGRHIHDEEIKRLIDMPLELRSTLGLVTAEELNEISHDTNLMHAINIRRRGSNLFAVSNLRRG